MHAPKAVGTGTSTPRTTVNFWQNHRFESLLTSTIIQGKGNKTQLLEYMLKSQVPYYISYQTDL